MTNMLLSWQPDPQVFAGNNQEQVILKLTLDGADYFIQGKVNCSIFPTVGFPQNYSVRMTTDDGTTELDSAELDAPHGETVVLETWVIGYPAGTIVDLRCSAYWAVASNARLTGTQIDTYSATEKITRAHEVKHPSVPPPEVSVRPKRGGKRRSRSRPRTGGRKVTKRRK